MFYKKQLETYNEIGDDKLEIFYSKYDNIFSEFDKNRSLKISNLKNQQKEEIIKLTEKNNKPSEMIKY